MKLVEKNGRFVPVIGFSDGKRLRRNEIWKIKFKKETKFFTIVSLLKNKEKALSAKTLIHDDGICLKELDEYDTLQQWIIHKAA